MSRATFTINRDNYLINLYTKLRNIPTRGLKFKSKTVHAQRKTKLATQHALEHFDAYYTPVYEELWRSMRIAMLSPSKYCALLNNYSNTEETVVRLLCDGADDILQHARKQCDASSWDNKEKLEVSLVQAVSNENLFDEAPSSVAKYEPELFPGQDPRLFDFMPVNRVVSAHQELIEEEIQQNILSASERQEPVALIPNDPVVIPLTLKAFMFGMGNVQMFEEPAVEDTSGKLDYYCMDPGSLLPVLALDLLPDCTILDMCSAPGGKTLAMLQTMLPGSLTCLDISWSRLQRLHRTLKTYLPKEVIKDVVRVKQANAVRFCVSNTNLYDRILVDVPCFTDRHVVNEPDNNMFRPSRIRDRLEIQTKQRELLYMALKRVKPGGVVVYSTCTLSPPQNDGIIQQTMEEIQEKTDLQVAVQNTSSLVSLFKDNIHFYHKCRFGQLVIPKTTSNCGPTYFCKLKRIS